MKVSRFTVNPFGENTYILWDPKTREAAIVDPGMSNASEEKAVDDFIEKNQLTLTYMLFTHLHLDHLWGSAHIKSKYNLEPYGANEENMLGVRVAEQAAMFGVSGKIDNVKLLNLLFEGNTVKVGDEELKVIQIAGHSPGGLAFYCPTSNFVIPGDIIFQGSVGRSDLPGGDYEKLISGIKEKLLSLPDDTIICPGHGDVTDRKSVV